MSFKSGKDVFTTKQGTKYLTTKYLTSAEMSELRSLNDGFHNKRFEDFLFARLERKAGNRFIPDGYNDEIVRFVQADVGSQIQTKTFKTVSGDVDVLTTYEGQNVYYDKNNRLRDYKSGRFTKIET